LVSASPNPSPSLFPWQLIIITIDINAVVIESIWYPSNNTTPTPTPLTSTTKAATRVSPVVPLRTFIQEVLKRSRTTYSTLQTALFYLFRARPTILNQLSANNAYISCGRRMFLASLVVASKFVQDKTYRNSAWAKIAGLPVSEINTSERYFLGMLNYRLYIDQTIFDHWHKLLHLRTQARMHNIPTFLIDLLSCNNLSFAPLLKENSYPISTNQHLLLSPQQQPYHYQHSTSITSTTINTTPPPLLYYSNSSTTTSPASTTSSSTTTPINYITLQQQQQRTYHLSPSMLPPALSLSSLPSSISSSPAQIPTPPSSQNQTSPVRGGGGNKRKHQSISSRDAFLDNKKHCRFWH
jgi:hypothetical protein